MKTSPCIPAAGVKKSSTSVLQNKAVICLLSLAPTISTRASPCLSIVHDEDGTMLSPVWSQFRTSSGGISSIETVAVTSSRNAFLRILSALLCIYSWMLWLFYRQISSY